MTDRLDGADLDSWWDFDDPDGTLVRFGRTLDVLDPASVAAAELATQQARAHGLAGRPQVAEELLARTASHHAGVVRTRTALERGRLLNSAGSPAQAVPFFTDAATSAGDETYLLVDALHMLALADPAGADRWTGDALAVVAGSSDPRVRRWAGALRNNLGWARFEQGDLLDALHQFEAALESHLAHGTPFQVHVAHWSVGRALRELGRLDEALAVQRGLAERDEADGYVEQELAELARLQGRADDAAAHRARAAALLD